MNDAKKIKLSFPINETIGPAIIKRKALARLRFGVGRSEAPGNRRYCTTVWKHFRMPLGNMSKPITNGEHDMLQTICLACKYAILCEVSDHKSMAGIQFERAPK